MSYAVSGFQYNGKHKEVYQYSVDYDYLNVIGMQLLAGRNFDAAIASDTVNSVIINEAMVKNFGWTIQNAVGQKIKGYEIQAGKEIISPVVIGVVKDFNYLSFAEKIEPQMFNHFSSNAPYKFFIRIKAGDPSQASGEFVGMVADDPDNKIELKTFHCEIINDHEALKKEQDNYKEIPVLRKLDNSMIQRNYLQIKQDIWDIVQTEMERVLNDSGLRHLVIGKHQ